MILIILSFIFGKLLYPYLDRILFGVNCYISYELIILWQIALDQQLFKSWEEMSIEGVILLGLSGLLLGLWYLNIKIAIDLYQKQNH